MAEFRACAMGAHHRCEGITFGNSESEGAMCDCACHGDITREAAAVPTLPSAESRRWEVLQLVVKHGGYHSLQDELKALKAYEKFLETGETD